MAFHDRHCDECRNFRRFIPVFLDLLHIQTPRPRPHHRKQSDVPLRLHRQKHSPRKHQQPRHIPALVRAAVAAGADALFLETHPEPAKGLSDTTNMLPLDRLRPLLEQALELRAAAAPFGWEAAPRG